jgi:peptidoglycan hydrolase-like protein with peptidoglycan-binding domain
MQEQNLSKDEIQQVQQALDQKGFKSGQPDGVLGPETKNAIKEFQQKQGWNATGELDNQTLSALGVSTKGQNATGQRPSNTANNTRRIRAHRTARNGFTGILRRSNPVLEETFRQSRCWSFGSEQLIEQASSGGPIRGRLV